jgi:hypothetical protein
MGIDYTTYAFYGVHIPKELWTERDAGSEADLVQALLEENSLSLADVGYMQAGSYDDDMLFLVAGGATESELGSFGRFDLDMGARRARFDGLLSLLVSAMGYDTSKLDPPSYISVVNEY